MLGPQAWAAPGPPRFDDVRRHRQVDSTNRVAMDLAAQGQAEGVVVVADHQTAGRGRRGRSWLDAGEPGSSLLVSVLLRPRLPDGRVHLLVAVVALAAADACTEVAAFRPGLKWPNDLVVPGPGGVERKLGGILAEARVEPGVAAPAVVVGLGLNLRWPGGRPPPELAGAALAAEEVSGGPVERDALLAAFLGSLEDRYRAAVAGDGWDGVLAEYRQRCVTLGRPVRVQLPDREVTGRAVDLADDGALVVEVAPGRRQTMAAGDVVHLDPV